MAAIVNKVQSVIRTSSSSSFKVHLKTLNTTQFILLPFHEGSFDRQHYYKIVIATNMQVL